MVPVRQEHPADICRRQNYRSARGKGAMRRGEVRKSIIRRLWIIYNPGPSIP